MSPAFQRFNTLWRKDFPISEPAGRRESGIQLVLCQRACAARGWSCLQAASVRFGVRRLDEREGKGNYRFTCGSTQRPGHKSGFRSKGASNSEEVTRGGARPYLGLLCRASGPLAQPATPRFSYLGLLQPVSRERELCNLIAERYASIVIEDVVQSRIHS